MDIMLIDSIKVRRKKKTFSSAKLALAKTISWRVIGTIDTMVISYLLTGSMQTAFSIGSIEVVSKMLLYYLHERVWQNISLKARALLKTISWRIVGTLDTMAISYFLTGNFKIAFSIGSVEVISKMVLYYLHERAWDKALKK